MMRCCLKEIAKIMFRRKWLPLKQLMKDASTTYSVKKFFLIWFEYNYLATLSKLSFHMNKLTIILQSSNFFYITVSCVKTKHFILLIFFVFSRIFRFWGSSWSILVITLQIPWKIICQTNLKVFWNLWPNLLILENRLYHSQLLP